jgi:hypothetical protein
LEKDYGLEGQMYDKINEVRIGGIVTGISTPSDKLCYIMLQTVKGGHPSAILTKVFINQYNQEFLKSIKRGDNLIVCGTIQSKQRKSKERKNLYFENLIGMDMSKIEETKVS